MKDNVGLLPVSPTLGVDAGLIAKNNVALVFSFCIVYVYWLLFRIEQDQGTHDWQTELQKFCISSSSIKPWTPHHEKENSRFIACFLIDEAKKVHFDFAVASFELVELEFK